MDAGAINVGGTTTITLNNGARWSILDIAGGVFTSTDTTNAGIQIGGVYAAAEAELLIRAGTVNAYTVTLGDSIQTSGTDLLLLTNASLYLGAGASSRATVPRRTPNPSGWPRPRLAPPAIGPRRCP
jgi:hypothetical protein